MRTADRRRWITFCSCRRPCRLGTRPGGFFKIISCIYWIAYYALNEVEILQFIWCKHSPQKVRRGWRLRLSEKVAGGFSTWRLDNPRISRSSISLPLHWSQQSLVPCLDICGPQTSACYICQHFQSPWKLFVICRRKSLNMSHLLLLGKFEYTGGPIFKAVLEC